MNVTGWSRGLEVSGGGQGVVSHAGLALLRHLAGKTGLTGGLSRGLASARVLVDDRGRGLGRPGWAVSARRGALPGVGLGDRALEGVTCIRLDATVTLAHSDKELAEANFKG